MLFFLILSKKKLMNRDVILIQQLHFKQIMISLNLTVSQWSVEHSLLQKHQIFTYYKKYWVSIFYSNR